MKILFLLTQDLLSPAGAGRYFPLACALAARGHTVRIAALHSDFSSLELTEFTRENVRVSYVGQMHVRKVGDDKVYFSSRQLLWVVLAATWALTRAAFTERVDVIHIGKPHPMNSIAGVLAKLLRRCSLVLDCDDLEAANNRFQSRVQAQLVGRSERLAMHTADHITTHSSVIQDYLVAAGIPLHKITYLPHGVDLQRFGTVDSLKVVALRESLELKDRKVVVYVGSMSSVCHALDLLMLAFVEVQRQVPDSVLLFVGGGEDYKSLQQLASSLNLGEHVRFSGRIDPGDVPLFYALGDVSVAPVQNNDAGRASLSLKMFESWAAGVPFVTVDIGDRRTVMGSPPAGVLVPPDDASSMASAIVRLLLDPGERQALRDRQLQLASEYGWDGLAERVEGVYQALGSDARRRSWLVI